MRLVNIYKNKRTKKLSYINSLGLIDTIISVLWEYRLIDIVRTGGYIWISSRQQGFPYGSLLHTYLKRSEHHGKGYLCGLLEIIIWAPDGAFFMPFLWHLFFLKMHRFENVRYFFSNFYVRKVDIFCVSTFDKYFNIDTSRVTWISLIDD